MLTKNDLSQIKTVVQEAMQPEIKALKKSIATKEDMKTLETGLRGEMKTLETGLKGELETGLKGLEKRFNGKMENFETRLMERIDEAQMEIIATVDKHKADKLQVNNLQERVVRLEDNAGLPPYPSQ